MTDLERQQISVLNRARELWEAEQSRIADRLPSSSLHSPQRRLFVAVDNWQRAAIKAAKVQKNEN